MKKPKLMRVVSCLLIIATFLSALASCKGGSKDPDKQSTTTSQKITYPQGTPYSGEQITLLDSSLTPVIYIDENDFKQSVRAAHDLADDFRKVSSKSAEIVNSFDSLKGSKLAIIAGTLGHSELIDALAENKTFDSSEIAGKWEAYTIKVVEGFEGNIEKAVIIAGSDKRGTAYGLYTISELIGVSPWYYWGDVEIEQKTSINVSLSSLEQTEMPDVKYRGIFLNDEELFTIWSKKFTAADNPGAPNPKVYATVFELILRLKANTLWPAMHKGTTPFNEYKNPKTGVSYNAELADDYGVIMSASHCEMMLRNNEGEWENWAKANAKKYGIKQVDGSWRNAYDYTVNPKAMNAYWEERVAENYRFENIYMIGLRGVHDSGINCSQLSDKSYKGKATVVKAAVKAQLEILEKYEKKLAEETGETVKFQTAYCVYKEAAEYFKYDLGLPTDCCLVYCDDNYGYVRSVPTDSDFKKYSSFGMYYHISYHGAPYSYLWVANEPLELIAEEMLKTYNSGMTDLWVLNVGDIKPGEVKTEYFLDMAWDVSSHSENNTKDFYKRFLKQNFALSDKECSDFADSLAEFYQIMHNYLPEHMGKRNLEYSPVAWGGETMVVLDKVSAINAKSAEILEKLPDGKKASFYELFHYTIYSYMRMVEKYAYKSMNEICAEQGRYAAANIYADLSEAAYKAVIAEAEYYNKVNASGKWNGILNPYGGVAKVDSGAPTLTRFSSDHTSPGAGLVGEGQSSLDLLYTLTFGSLANEQRYIDIFNKGNESAAWTLTAPEWIIISDSKGNILQGTDSGSLVLYSGTVEVEDRYSVSVDFSKLTLGSTEGELVLTDAKGNTSKVPLKASKSSYTVNPDERAYYEENGLVSIQAENYSKTESRGEFSWVRLDNLGRVGSSMKAVSSKGFSRECFKNSFSSKSPYLDYDIYFSTPGKYEGVIYRLPTLNESAEGRTTCTVAYSFDGSAVKILRGIVGADDNGSSAWGNMIMVQHDKLEFTVEVKEAGKHTFRIYMGDCNMIVDEITLAHESLELPYSRLAPPETFNTVSYTKPAIGSLPESSFEMVNWIEFANKNRYDFTASAPHAGFMKIDALGAGSENGLFYWQCPENAQSFNRTAAEKMETVDKSFVTGDSEASFKFKAEPDTKYGITIAVGDAEGQIKAENMSVMCGGQTLLSGISSSKGVGRYSFTVTSDSEGYIKLTFGGKWIINSLEAIKYKESTASGSGEFIANGKGNFVIEAESALENSEHASNSPATDGSAHAWSEVAGTSGSALFFGPNTGAGYTNSSLSSNKSAKLQYKLDFKESGTYNVWMLVNCAGLEDDSILVGLDGASMKTKNVIGNTEGFKWVQITTLDVSSEGIHTLNICGREDGFSLDKILLTKGTPSESDFEQNELREA